MSQFDNSTADELLQETLKHLPRNTPFDWRTAVAKQILALANIPWNVRNMGLTEEQARNQATDPIFVAYRTMLIEYFPKGNIRHPGATTAFNTLLQIVSKRRKSDYWGRR